MSVIDVFSESAHLGSRLSIQSNENTKLTGFLCLIDGRSYCIRQSWTWERMLTIYFCSTVRRSNIVFSSFCSCGVFLPKDGDTKDDPNNSETVDDVAKGEGESDKDSAMSRKNS